MKRRTFIKHFCYSGLGITVIGSILESCSGIHYVTAKTSGKAITIPTSSFNIETEDGSSQREYVYVVSRRLTHPVCLRKINEACYLALLLKCTHRGCEVSVGGASITCPCHGSEFTLDGAVIEGPAMDSLVTYKTEVKNETIYIHLT